MQKLFVLSANHTNMALAERERLAITPENQSACYAALREASGVSELYLLSTCNRTELYACCDNAENFEQLVDAFAAQAGVESGALNVAERLNADAAVAHLLRVACGMHSMVLGEPQILGQIKSAYATAKRQHALGGRLEQLMQFAFARVKEIRTAMPLGREPVSIASTMVKLVEQIFDHFDDKRLLLVGAGETIELAARYLTGLGIKQITISNRTIERAEELAARFSARAAPFYDLPQLLSDADLVVTATASQLPIIGKGMVEAATSGRHSSSLVLFDLAVPRDIEAQVGEIDGVFIYAIDDLGAMIEQNKTLRRQASDKAEALIAAAVTEYRQLQRRAHIGRTVVAPFRSRAEQLRDAELEQAMRNLASGKMPEFVLFELAHNLTKKLLHTPSVEAKRNNADPRIVLNTHHEKDDPEATRH